MGRVVITHDRWISWLYEELVGQSCSGLLRLERLKSRFYRFDEYFKTPVLLAQQASCCPVFRPGAYLLPVVAVLHAERPAYLPPSFVE